MFLRENFWTWPYFCHNLTGTTTWQLPTNYISVGLHWERQAMDMVEKCTRASETRIKKRTTACLSVFLFSILCVEEPPDNCQKPVLEDFIHWERRQEFWHAGLFFLLGSREEAVMYSPRMKQSIVAPAANFWPRHPAFPFFSFLPWGRFHADVVHSSDYLQRN